LSIARQDDAQARIDRIGKAAGHDCGQHPRCDEEQQRRKSIRALLSGVGIQQVEGASKTFWL
jgi:hypothetical protein